VCIFYYQEIGTVKRRLTDNFSWGLFVWDKLFHGCGSTHLSQVMPRPPLKFADSHKMAKIYKCNGIIQPSVKQKPGIRMLINCERRSLDKEKQKEKKI